MAPSRRTRIFAAIALLSALIAGCGSSSDNQLSVAVVGQPDDPFENGVRLSVAGQLVRASVAEGLVAFDEQGRVVPALADRWIVTDDGQSYIFRLRDGTWRDGSEITARGTVRSLRAAIEALRGTSLGLDLAGIAEIREMAGRVIEIRLSYPAPYLLQLLAQPELGLTSGGSAVGPMRLERSGDTAMLTPIPPVELGLPEVRNWDERVRAIALFAASGAEAVSRFNAGEADLVLGGGVATFPHTADVGILRGTIQLDPVEGLFGLEVASQSGFLADANNREVLALAIDRSALIAPFGVDGWKASTDLVPPSLITQSGPEAERWAGLAMEERRALAKARVADWRQAQGASANQPRLSVWLPEGPGSDLLFERLEQDYLEIGILLARAGKRDAADLRLMDAVARYPAQTWYLNQFSCRTRRAVCSADADAALAAARATADPVERAELIGKAQVALAEANVFIPFGSPIRWSLVRGDAFGFAANRWGWHPLMPMALRPK